jgi:hypothetical protein
MGISAEIASEIVLQDAVSHRSQDLILPYSDVTDRLSLCDSANVSNFSQ